LVTPVKTFSMGTEDGSLTTANGSTDNYPHAHRMQSAMVLFALEEALGTFVVQSAHQPESLPIAMRAEIEKRINGAGFVPVSQIVQETYIKEIIDLATAASKDRSESESLARLRTLVEVLDAFEVRNSVCHPNRPFPECYWHRMAALATDPCIEQLRLRKVSDAFRCACENRLTPPPEGWLQQRSSNIPNNLPTTFDHHITGLIARQDEARELRKRLQNKRNSLVAIVGPGGTGKTALCLDVLHACVLDPTALEWTDQVVYVTAKTERLTVRGVETIADPVTSLDSVKRSITLALYGLENGVDDSELVSFDQASREMGDRRVLLCIDNLETILRDHPQDFEDFAQSLPQHWRVLVTSRVTVNAANVLTLLAIKREGAVKLARDYSSLRGTGRIAEAQLGRLVDVCDRNPLAIRLVLDSYSAGSELASALVQTRERIVDFSYTSLVDHLPPDASKVLECLFGSTDPLSRGQIGHLLELSPDEVAEAVNSLLKTSLVTREVASTSERYALSSSVRDLLVRAPRDKRVRDQVYNSLRNQQRIIAELEENGTRDSLNESFVPSTSPNHIRALVVRLRASVMGRTSRADQLRDLVEVRRSKDFDPTDAVLHRTEGLLLEQLGDRYGAIESFSRAVGCAIPDLCAQLRLAEILKDEHGFEEAIERARPLINGGLLSNPDSSPRNRARLLRAYWLPVLWMGKHDEVIAATEAWQSSELRPAYAALRVSAIRCALEAGPSDAHRYEHYVEQILSCLNEAFRLDGYLAYVVHEGFRAFEKLQTVLLRRTLSQTVTVACAKFLDEHLAEMCGTSNEYSISDAFVRNLINSFREAVQGQNNPLRTERWSDIVKYGNATDPALEEVGYEQAKITNLLTKDKGALFARATDGSRDFYIRMENTQLSLGEFSALKLGQSLMVLPSDDPPSKGRAWPAKHVMLA
jgi:tetratricopeptide (TPR) repeat protein